MASLVEREDELGAIDALLEDARRGRGGVLVVEGPAGIGKTSLVRRARDEADARGILVLDARGGVLESRIAFGVVRQLFEPVLRRAGRRERDQLLADAAGLSAPVFGLPLPAGWLPAVDRGESARHGLYWLLADLAAERPVLVAIDDVQWADPASVEWLSYTQRRLEGLPVAILASARTGEPHTEAASTLRVVLASSAVVAPAPLTPNAVGVVLAAVLNGAVDEAFAEACWRATAGNPLFVGELARALLDAGVQPIAANRDAVAHVGAGRLGRFVEARLASLPAEATRLARAVATLGAGAEVRHAAALCGLDHDRALAVADVLREADVLRPSRALEFVHPVVGEAIADAMGVGERSGLHARAAGLLHTDGAALEEIAVHLLAAEPDARPWAVECLRGAAREASGRGDPRTAVAFLRRALEEGVGSLRCPVLVELGVAEASLRDPHAIAHLTEARALTEDAVERAALAMPLGRALMLSGDGAAAMEVFEQAVVIARDGDAELALRLQAEIWAGASLDAVSMRRAFDQVTTVDQEPAGTTQGQRALLVGLGTDAAWRGSNAALALARVRRAVADGTLLREQTSEAPTVYLAAATLAWCDEPEEAVRLLDAALADGRARGSPIAFAQGSSWRAFVAIRGGDVAAAEAHATAALDVGRRHGFVFTTPNALASLVVALLDRGRPDAATEALEAEGMAGAVPPHGNFLPLIYARGLLYLARGRPRDALADLRNAGRIAVESGCVAESPMPWRSASARALAALGEDAAAAELVEEALALTRSFGTSPPVAIALQARALLEPPTERVATLREAVALLAPSGARLEHARALCDLGTALRHTRALQAARDPLREALDAATRCGAVALTQRAHDELLATGARPRRTALLGRDALTPAERRAADLAADGLTNRDIAQALFVTTKTVESHLAHVYRKLDVRSRRDLAAALESTAPSARVARDDT